MKSLQRPGSGGRTVLKILFKSVRTQSMGSHILEERFLNHLDVDVECEQ